MVTVVINVITIFGLVGINLKKIDESCLYYLPLLKLKIMFTQSCFIRKNTPELRKKLEDLGYKKSEFGSDLNNSIATTVFNDKPSYSCIREQSFDDTNPHTTWGFEFRIDCGDSEELFLALAALRDDTDKNQYCIDSEGNWFLYNKTYIRLLSKTVVNWHKATVKEIIGHFKTK